jgi:hypothetical protein
MEKELRQEDQQEQQTKISRLIATPHQNIVENIDADIWQL